MPTVSLDTATPESSAMLEMSSSWELGDALSWRLRLALALLAAAAAWAEPRATEDVLEGREVLVPLPTGCPLPCGLLAVGLGCALSAFRLSSCRLLVITQAGNALCRVCQGCLGVGKMQGTKVCRRRGCMHA